MNIVAEDISKILQAVDFSPLAGRSILVTGGSGLLGSYIVDTLRGCIEGGLDVDLFVQSRRPLRLSAIPYIRHVYADLANTNDCARLPHADVIIAAHSYAQPMRFIADPLIALRSASHGLLALLERCNVGGRFLYISSSEVYCDSPTPPPYSEGDIGCITPYHPRACYITGKAFGEAMTYLYHNRGISTVSVRPGITYGPGFRRDDQRSWASFVRRAVDTGEIHLLDAGNVQRTLCYMTDGIELLFRILLTGTQPVYNLAGKTTHTIAEIAETIALAADAKVFYPGEDHGIAGTPENLALDTGRVDAEFGKRDYVTLAEGMQRTVDWYRGEYA